MKISKLNEQVDKDTKKLEVLRDEIAKVLLGESVYTKDDLTTAMQSLKDKIASAKSELKILECEAHEKSSIVDSIIPAYKRFRSWAIIFDEAPMETKKMIASQIFNKVTVNRKYEIIYELNFTYRQFCEDWIAQKPIFSESA